MLAVQGMCELTHAERTVLSVIAWHDGRGGCWPSLERIAELAGGMHRSTVVEHRAELRRKGRLSWRRGQRGSIYTIAYRDGFHRQGIPDDGNGRPEIPSSGNSDIPLSGNSDSHRQGIPDGNGIEPTREPHEPAAAAVENAAATRAKGTPREALEAMAAQGMPWAQKRLDEDGGCDDGDG